MASGIVEPPMPAIGMRARCAGGEVRVVEHAGHEEGGAATEADVLGLHDAQHLARVPDVEDVDRLVLEQRQQQGVEHADEVADRRAGERWAACPRRSSRRAGGPRSRACGASG